MPYLPIQVAGGSASGGVAPARPGAVDPSGLTRAAGEIGSAFENLRRYQEHKAEQLAQDEARTSVTNAMSRADEMWREKMEAARQQAPKDGAGFTAGLLKDWDGWAAQQEKEMPERGREMLRSQLSTMRSQVHARAFQFEVGQRERALQDDFDDGLQSDQRVLLKDPSRFTERAAARVALARSLSLPEAARDALAEKTREVLSSTAAAGEVERDPAGWLKRDPTSDPIKSVMKPADIARMDGHAKAVIERAKSQATAGRDRAVAEATRAFSELSDFVLEGGLVSPEYEQRVMSMVGDQPGMVDAAAQLVKVSREGAGYASLPLPHQKAGLKAMGTPGSPEQAKMIEHMARITAKQEADYKANPWAAAEKHGRMPPSPPVQLGMAEQIPQLIAERMKVISGVDVRAGSLASPIREEELPQVQALLSALPIERRADLLAQIGSMLPPQRIAKLAEQLDKGDRPTSLMLMAASDRTTDGLSVARRIGVGAQAIKDKTVKKDDQALTGWRSEISGLIRGSIPDEKMEDAAIDAAYYVRAALELEGRGDNQLAARLTVGYIREGGGVKTLLPRGMKDGEFDAKLRDYTADKLAGRQYFVRGKEVPAAWVANRIADFGYRRDGRGQFVPEYNGAHITTDKEGTSPLALEIR